MGYKQKDDVYEGICEKLGFVPSEYRCTPTKTEDDTEKNPFSVLTAEELEYLFDNGYL